MVEDLHGMRVKAAAAALFEVEQAEEQLAARKLRGAVDARAGWERGSRLEALAAETSAVNDAARAELLGKVAGERRQQLQAALQAHRESRLEAQQVEGLAKRVRTREQSDAERRAQSESDDRFLSRRLWLQGRD